MPLPPSGPFDIPDASGHSIGLSRQPVSSSASQEEVDLAEIIDFSASSEALIIEEEGDEYEAAPIDAPIPVTTDVLISLADASTKLGPQILDTLDAKFKGQLAEVRHLDERDLIF